jgi:hypothetical protein
MDPRITTPAAALRQQYEGETHLVTLIDANFEAQAEARGLDHQLETLSKQTTGSMAAAVAGLRKKVANIAGPHAESEDSASKKEVTLSQVASDLGGVYGALGGADAAPTTSQLNALAAVEKDDGEVMARWKSIKAIDLPALNRELTGAGIAAIKVKAEAEPASESENEE